MRTIPFNQSVRETGVPSGEEVAKTKHLGLDRSCVLAAFYQRRFVHGTSALYIINGNFRVAARELGIDLPVHRLRTALENMALSNNGKHRRLVRNPDNWAEVCYRLKEECLASV